MKKLNISTTGCMTHFHRTAQNGPDQNTKKWEATVQQRKKLDTSGPAFTKLPRTKSSSKEPNSKNAFRGNNAFYEFSFQVWIKFWHRCVIHRLISAFKRALEVKSWRFFQRKERKNTAGLPSKCGRIDYTQLT